MSASALWLESFFVKVVVFEEREKRIMVLEK